jgi:RNA polymerase sigma factor (sigma-70 family)
MRLFFATMKIDESILINECLKGNTEAFREIVERHQNSAYTLAFRITGNSEDAEEIVQDAFLKAYNSLPGFKGESKFGTWLYKIVLNMAISKVRRKKQNLHYIDEITTEIAESDEHLRKTERTYYVEKAIASLPEDEAAIVTFYYMEDLTIEDISGIVNLSPTNTKVKLFRARKKMAELLKSTLKEDIYTII